jgi:vitamin B12 transporter
MKSPNTYKRIVIAGSLAASLFAIPLSADTLLSNKDVAETTGVLEPYVVVATRTPLALDRVSPSVDYIDEEQIEQWQAKSVVDIIDKQPGMAVVSSGAIGSQTSLFSRGTDSNHTGFFLDGRRLSPGFGNQYDLEFLSIGNLSSVQIQRGASSVNYGSSGIGGAIDLRTKSALDEATSSGSLEVEVGSNNYRRAAASTSVIAGDFGMSLATSSLSTDNERPNDAYGSEQITTRMDYRLSDNWSLELIGQYLEADKELPGSIVDSSADDNQETENWLISPGLRYATDTLSMHLFYSHSTTQTTLHQVRSSYDEFWNYRGDYLTSNVIEVESDEVNLQLDYSLTDDVLLSTGLVYRRDDASNSNTEFDPLNPVVAYANTFEQVGIYGQALWIIGDLELRGGVRYDDYSEFDSEITGSAEIIYHLHNIEATIFTKLATSYSPPGASDIAFDLPKYQTPLSSEEATTYEIGFRQSLFEGDLEWSIVAFYNDIDDLLDYKAIEVAPFEFDYDSINVKSAETHGVEFSMAYSVTEKLAVSAGYTYLTALDKDTDTRLSRRPRHMLQFAADYQFNEALNVGLQGTGYIAREDIDPTTYALGDAEDFFVARLVADWALNDRVTLFARVENLFDKSYAPAAGFPALGRAGYIGARWTF